MKLSEKLAFSLIFGFVALGVWLSHSNIDGYVGWYAGEHALLEWLTLTSIVCAILVCFYRVSILSPFRKTSFVTGLCIFAATLFLFGLLEWFRRWGIVGDIVPSWSVAFLFFSYLVVLPLFYLKFPKVRKRVDDWAIPLPRSYHIAFYAVLIVAHYITKESEQRPEQLQFGACWLFFMVMMEPLNRVIFSRTTIER